MHGYGLLVIGSYFVFVTILRTRIHVGLATFYELLPVVVLAESWCHKHRQLQSRDVSLTRSEQSHHLADVTMKTSWFSQFMLVMLVSVWLTGLFLHIKCPTHPPACYREACCRLSEKRKRMLGWCGCFDAASCCLLHIQIADLICSPLSSCNLYHNVKFRGAS